MEVEARGEDAMPEIALMVTGAYFDLPDRQDEDGRVSAEIHMVAQCVCRQASEVSYIADIYSNRTMLVRQTAELPMTASVSPVSIRQTVTGTVETMGGSGEALTLSASVGSVTVEGDTVKTAVNLRVICRQSDGNFVLSRSRLAAEFTTTELPAGTELQNISVTAADLFYSVVNSGLDVRAVLQMDALAVTEKTVACVVGVTEDAEAI